MKLMDVETKEREVIKLKRGLLSCSSGDIYQTNDAA